MTCVDLPDTVDLSGQEFDQSVVRYFSQMEQPRHHDEIQPFTRSQKPFLGPKVVRVGVPRALTFEEKKCRRGWGGHQERLLFCDRRPGPEEPSAQKVSKKPKQFVREAQPPTKNFSILNRNQMSQLSMCVLDGFLKTYTHEIQSTARRAATECQLEPSLCGEEGLSE